MTAAARFTLVLSAVFILAATAFDSPSLYVPGVALALLVVAARVWVGVAANRARLEQPPGPRTMIEGEPYLIDVHVEAGWLPLPGGLIVHPLARRPAPIGLRSWRRRARLEVRSLRRGRRDVAPATLLLGDPMRLHTAEVSAGRRDRVLVLPRIEPVTRADGSGGGGAEGALDGLDGTGAGGLDTRPIDFEIDGLRPYRHGSPAARIHWPTVARTGEMVEHRLVAGADSSPLVVLDSSAPADDDALDAAVRAAASLCVHLARRGGCGLLLCGERRALEVDRRAWPQVHARLAVVEAGGSAPSVRRANVAPAVFWVTAAGTSPHPLNRSGARCYVVSPLPLPGVRPSFAVAGCVGGRLPSVARATARAA